MNEKWTFQAHFECTLRPTLFDSMVTRIRDAANLASSYITEALALKVGSTGTGIADILEKRQADLLATQPPVARGRPPRPPGPRSPGDGPRARATQPRGVSNERYY